MRYVIFTDAVRQTCYQDGWEIRPLLFKHEDSARMARFHKTNSDLVLPDTDVTIWIDGTQRIKTDADLAALAKSVLANRSIATFRHPVRSCVYEELRACISYRKDLAAVMTTQVERYRKEGYPPNNGLVETACVIRKHTERVKKFNELWWHEIKNGSKRDQLSFNYAVWRLGIDYQIIPGKRTNSHFFQFMPHVNMRRRKKRKRKPRVKK